MSEAVVEKADVPGLRERQKRARERRILTAGERLFTQRGYAQTSMEDVARRARLAVGTLYNYFPSKPDLLAAIVRRETDGYVEAGAALVRDPQADPQRAIADLLLLYTELFTEHDRSVMRELLSATLADPERVGIRVLDADLQLMAQLVSLLETLRGRGLLAEDVDVPRSAGLLYSLYLTLCLGYVINGAATTAQLREELTAGIAVAMDGIAPASPH